MTFKVIGDLIIRRSSNFCLPIQLENGLRNEIKTSRATFNLRTWLSMFLGSSVDLYGKKLPDLEYLLI